MNVMSAVMAIFSTIGGIDRIIGNKMGLGKEFEKGFMLFGTMMLSMTGMIIISPLIAEWLEPIIYFFQNVLHLDPSVIPASFFANDMGGASLAKTIATSEVGMFNALVVSSMMGCTISFTIPYALGAVPQEKHKDMLLGFLCGIVTIPIGCFVSGLMNGIGLVILVRNLLLLIILAGIISACLILCPQICIKIFGILGNFIKVLITIGLILGIIRFLTGYELIKGLDTIENGAGICLNAAIVMSGAFPLISIISRLLAKPIRMLGEKAKINESSAIGFISSLATSVTTFELMKNMDKKGTVLNSAFAVSAAFTFAGHLAFTMAFDVSYVGCVIVGKLVSGVCAVIVAEIIYRRMKR